MRETPSPRFRAEMETRRSISASAAAEERDAMRVWITLDLSGGCWLFVRLCVYEMCSSRRLYERMNAVIFHASVC